MACLTFLILASVQNAGITYVMAQTEESLRTPRVLPRNPLQNQRCLGVVESTVDRSFCLIRSAC